MIRFEASLPTLLLVAASSLVNKTDRNKFYARDNNKKWIKHVWGMIRFSSVFSTYIVPLWAEAVFLPLHYGLSFSRLFIGVDVRVSFSVGKSILSQN